MDEKYRIQPIGDSRMDSDGNHTVTRFGADGGLTSASRAGPFRALLRFLFGPPTFGKCRYCGDKIGADATECDRNTDCAQSQAR